MLIGLSFFFHAILLNKISFLDFFTGLSPQYLAQLFNHSVETRVLKIFSQTFMLSNYMQMLMTLYESATGGKFDVS